MNSAARTLSTGTAVDVVRAYFDAFSRNDVQAALDLMTQDVVWHVDGASNVPTVGLLRGRNQVRQWLENFPTAFTPRLFVIDSLLEGAGEVVAFGRFRHTVRATRRTVGSSLAIRFKVRDGRIAHYQILEDSLLLARAFDPADRWAEQAIRVNGTAYSYSDRGEGPCIVFAHGLFVDRHIFDRQVEALESEYRCIVLDMPGHGRSGHRAEGWTLNDIADDLALMIQELELGPACLVGQSQGGMVGLRLAARWPGLVSRLVLIGTSARAEYPERLDRWRAIRKVLREGSDAERETTFLELQAQLNDAGWLQEYEQAACYERKIMLAHDRGGIALAIDAAVIARQDVRATLPQISVPTLVICGDADRATPLELSREIATAIPGARLEILCRVGHHAPIEAPQAVSEALLTFVSTESS